eukprot:scaffold71422_cov20-Tisochrysis_lutea.AAC.2
MHTASLDTNCTPYKLTTSVGQHHLASSGSAKQNAVFATHTMNTVEFLSQRACSCCAAAQSHRALQHRALHCSTEHTYMLLNEVAASHNGHVPCHVWLVPSQDRRNTCTSGSHSGCCVIARNKGQAVLPDMSAEWNPRASVPSALLSMIPMGNVPQVLPEPQRPTALGKRTQGMKRMRTYHKG